MGLFSLVNQPLFLFLFHFHSFIINFFLSIPFLLVITTPASLHLCNRPNNQSSNALLLTPHSNLRRNPRLCRFRHPDRSHDTAARDSLTEELESVSRGVDNNICAIERLQRKGFGELFGCVYCMLVRSCSRRRREGIYRQCS